MSFSLQVSIKTLMVSMLLRPLLASAKRWFFRPKKEGPDGLFHFLHGVSPDGERLAFIGVNAEVSEASLQFILAEIYTIKSDGTDYRQITKGGALADGPALIARWSHSCLSRVSAGNHGASGG
jgi:hypothetical protein